MGLASPVQLSAMSYLKAEFMGEPSKAKGQFAEDMTATIKRNSNEVACKDRAEFMEMADKTAAIRAYIPSLSITFDQDEDVITAKIKQECWVNRPRNQKCTSQGDKVLTGIKENGSVIFKNISGNAEETARALSQKHRRQLLSGERQKVQQAFFDFWFSVYEGNPEASASHFAEELSADMTVTMNGEKAHEIKLENREQYLDTAKKVGSAVRFVESFSLKMKSFNQKNKTCEVQYDQKLIIENKVEGKSVWSKMHSTGTETLTYKINEQAQAIFTSVVTAEKDTTKELSPEEKTRYVEKLGAEEESWGYFSYLNPFSYFSKKPR